MPAALALKSLLIQTMVGFGRLPCCHDGNPSLDFPGQAKASLALTQKGMLLCHMFIYLLFI